MGCHSDVVGCVSFVDECLLFLSFSSSSVCVCVFLCFFVVFFGCQNKVKDESGNQSYRLQTITPLSVVGYKPIVYS